MYIYRVKWVKELGGNYVPPDGCSGDYYQDLHGEDIVTAKTAKTAKLVVEKVRQGAKVKAPVKICDA